VHAINTIIMKLHMVKSSLRNMMELGTFTCAGVGKKRECRSAGSGSDNG